MEESGGAIDDTHGGRLQDHGPAALRHIPDIVQSSRIALLDSLF